MLKALQLQVSKPLLRLCNPEPGESGKVEIPAYQVKNSGDTILANRVLQNIISEVFTRKYACIIPEMAHFQFARIEPETLTDRFFAWPFSGSHGGNEHLFQSRNFDFDRSG